MRNIPSRAWFLTLLSSGLQILVFPKPNLYVLAWIAVAPLLYALLRGRGGEGEMFDSEGKSLRPFTLWQGFLIAWVCGIIWYLGTCYWVYPVMNGGGKLPAPVAALITVGYCLLMGLHHGFFGLLVVLMARRSSLGNRRPLLLAPFFWVAIELMRDRIIGVPWDPLGGSQVDNIPFARIAQTTGVYGLSFAIMLVNCAFVAALLLYGQRRKNLLISAVAASIALQIGVFAKPSPFVATQQAILVQENVPLLDQTEWTPRYFDDTISSLARLSVDASKPRRAPENPGLIIWPESPAPFFIADPRLQQWLVAMAQDTNSYLVIGSLGEKQAIDGRQQLLNSALVMDPHGNMVGRYDKIHLVPYGEYVPFQDILFFANKLTREVGDFGRGTDRKVFDLNGTHAGIFICYESIFSNEVREFTANGAQVLINISDDLWYGETGAPAQHLQMARMRAMENHRWILLATNNGTSASIDPFGRVVKQAPRNIRTTLVVPYAPQNESTFYSRNGDVFAWICVVISMLAVLVRWRYAAPTMIEARPA
ncbi:MAG TPA: apolipoprotein N-acyltransferase [Candidatus Angelobacter sp.]|nr:apolipoprotein N-acyltransferase [Candidatus Angelobacter sp.]